MQILTMAIQKGGSGKTTTAAAIAGAAGVKGKRVLVIDLDPQGNLSFACKANTAAGSSFDLLHNTPITELIQPCTHPFDIIPAAWELSTETSSKGSATRLKKALEPLKNRYDLIVIDTPPTAGELQYNALFAATGLIIPLEADIYNLQSLYQITDTALQIQKTNKELAITGLILTKYDDRSTLARQLQLQIVIEATKRNIPYLGSVRNGIAIKEAAALQQNIFNYAPKSKPAADYMEIAAKII